MENLEVAYHVFSLVYHLFITYVVAVLVFGREDRWLKIWRWFRDPNPPEPT